MAKRGQSKYMPHLRNKMTASKPGAGRSYAVPRPSTGKETIIVDEMHYHNQRVADDAAPKDMSTKGRYGGLCNRSACLRSHSFWYNRGSYAHYCEDCANLINQEFRFRDDVEMYGSLLIQPPGDLVVTEFEADTEHCKPFGAVHSNGHIDYFDTEEEAIEHQKWFRRYVGLRSDGSVPLWFKEMSHRYEHLRTQVTIKSSL